jgi:hypothetical protein
LQSEMTGIPVPMYPPPYPRDTNGAYFTLPTYDLITGLGYPNITEIADALEATGGMTVSIAAPLPSAPVVNGSAAITISASATGGPTSYQWYLNDGIIPGATGTSLVIYPNAASEGTYTFVASNSSGSVSAVAGVLSIATDAWIVNLSARGSSNYFGPDPLIAGFVTTGPASKSLLIRGDGPALATYGVTGYLPDPELTLSNSSGTTLATAISWSASLEATFAQVGAFALAPGSDDTALLESLPPGAYTAQIAPQAAGNGIVLAEIYDADSGAPANRLVNISARAYVSSGASILIAGFVIAGSTPETVVIRGDGPGLNAVDSAVTDFLPNPKVTLYNSSGDVIASNAGWGSAPVPGSAAGSIEIQPLTASISARAGAFSLAVGSADSGVVVTLPPGSYTAQVAPATPEVTSPTVPGHNPKSSLAVGDALVEIYELR